MSHAASAGPPATINAPVGITHQTAHISLFSYIFSPFYKFFFNDAIYGKLQPSLGNTLHNVARNYHNE